MTNILMYEDKLLESAVLPFLSGLDTEIDRFLTIFIIIDQYIWYWSPCLA